MANRTSGIHMDFSSNRSRGHQHRPWMQQDPGCIMAPDGSSGHSDLHEPLAAGPLDTNMASEGKYCHEGRSSIPKAYQAAQLISDRPANSKSQYQVPDMTQFSRDPEGHQRQDLQELFKQLVLWKIHEGSPLLGQWQDSPEELCVNESMVPSLKRYKFVFKSASLPCAHYTARTWAEPPAQG
ncbi:hypothetical protein STEG23_029546 [Scotinomys teguina]